MSNNSPAGNNFNWNAITQEATINGQLIMGGILGPFVSPANFGIIYFDQASERFKASENGGAPVNLLTGGGGGSAYTNIAVNGTGQAQESELNLVGPFVGSDNPGVATNVTLPQATTSVDGYLSHTDWNTFNSRGSGTVTSVALTGDGTVFNSAVTGSPITSSGTFAPSLHTQLANTVLAGATSGGAVAPTFRALVAADLPSSGVTAASYTFASITVNAQGQVTAASSGTAASSVSNSDGTLTISPNTGAIVASLALGHVNTWTAKQSYTTISSAAALNLVPFAGDPSSGLTNGDMWYNSSTGKFRAYEAGTSKNLITSSSATTAYSTIQNNGSAVAAEQVINFIPGSGVSLSIADNPGVATNVTIAASGSSPTAINASVSNTVSPSLTTGADNVISFAINPGDYDNGSPSAYYSAGTPTRLTAPATGDYLVTLNGVVSMGTNTWVKYGVTFNTPDIGTAAFGNMINILPTNPAAQVGLSMTGVAALTSGQYVGVDVIPEGGSGATLGNVTLTIQRMK